MINDVIMDTSHDVICENNTREKDVVGIVTFDLIGLLPGGKFRRLSGRFQILIWRPGETVQNLESPGLSGRVDRHYSTSR